jgi:protein TonB
MSGPANRIGWFIALSAACHATALLIGNHPVPHIGPEGEMVHVTMTYHSDAAVPAPPAAATAGLSHAARVQPHSTGKPTPVGKAARRRHDDPPHVAAAAQPAMEPQAANAAVAERAAPPSAGSGTAREIPGEGLRTSIMQLVHRRLSYPLLARRKGWQGTVKLEVHIESDGRISRLSVQETSGYPVLDRAALQSLRLASVPDAGQWLNGQGIDIIIPVEYRLVGG